MSARILQELLILHLLKAIVTHIFINRHVLPILKIYGGHQYGTRRIKKDNSICAGSC